jgi:hypothetical protein
VLRETTVEGDKSFLDQLDPGTVAHDLVDDSLVRTALDQTGGPGVFHLAASLSRSETVLV